jgi:aminopeptidase-like protein
MRHRDVEGLPEGDYEVVVDADHDAGGSMTMGEIVIEGTGPGEVLVSTPVCHPGLANDNLSGVALLAELGRVLTERPAPRRTHRILLSPGTVGPIAWLAANRDRLGDLHAGLAVMCTGDPGPITYKASRRGDASVDRAAALTLRHRPEPHALREFIPWGGDERQFCSPGYDLPVGAISRTPPGEYPENHTSDDDLGLVSADALQGTLDAVLDILDVLEGDERPVSTSQHGEPQLGRRGLTRRRGGEKGGDHEMALLWVLNLADGRYSLIDCAERSGLPFAVIREAADALREVGLLTARAD